MGLFGSNRSPEEKEQEQKIWEQKLIDKTLEEYNIFEGVECEIILPEKQLKTSGSSGKKKAVATFAFGIIGWAATSGTSQNEENRIITTIFQIVNKGIVFKNGSIDGSDTRIPYDDIIKMEIPETDAGYRIGVITLLNNKHIIIKPEINTIDFTKIKIILNHISNIINERACGTPYEEAGWGLEHATAEPQEVNRESSSLMDELERLANLYEKGLLTDEEFALAKKKLLEGG